MVAEVHAILAALKGKKLERAAVALIAMTGLRPGEARGVRWEDWDRVKEHIAIKRAVWHTVESTPKTPGSIRFVTVPLELKEVLLSQWNDQESPMGGYILARAGGGRVNLDNMAKRTIIPTLEKVEPKPLVWRGFYALRRFHGTGVRSTSGSSDTTSKALGNSKEVANKHYIKPQEVFPDVRKAVNEAVSGLTVEQPLCN